MKLKPQRTCHYCGKIANTKDHIVPRHLLRRLHSDLELAVSTVCNIVPACNRCNQLKAHFRSTCTCFTCRTAWAVYGPVKYRGQIVDVAKLACEADEREAARLLDAAQYRLGNKRPR